MKKAVIAAMIVMLASVAYAAMPDVITYDAKNGAVTFDHNMHKKLGCKACHEGAPGPIEIDKNSAHGAACKDCHKEDGGPTKCGGCHKK